MQNNTYNMALKNPPKSLELRHKTFTENAREVAQAFTKWYSVTDCGPGGYFDGYVVIYGAISVSKLQRIGENIGVNIRIVAPDENGVRVSFNL